MSEIECDQLSYLLKYFYFRWIDVKEQKYNLNSLVRWHECRRIANLNKSEKSEQLEEQSEE